VSTASRIEYRRFSAPATIAGEVPERSNGAVSKTVVPFAGDRGFESLPLRHRWDPISARFMRQDFFTFSPAFKLWIGGNHKPGLRVDEAIRRRLNLIPFIGWCQSRSNP
jgi:hypothetical protein